MDAVTIVVDPGSQDEVWIENLRAEFPDAVIVGKDHSVDPTDVDVVVTWQHPNEKILSYLNLKAIVLASAGFDHLDDALFDHAPVVRLIDPAMADDITLYCLAWIIRFQRDFDVFERNAAVSKWKKSRPRFAGDVTVGVLGRGAIGSVLLDTVAGHGFATVGWSRSDHDRPLLDFFSDCDVVVNLLPYSEATHHAVGREQLAALGNGVLINVGRGGTVDNGALLDALDGELRAAVLDVFETEPLPTENPLWRHPKITITPHVAGRTDAMTASAVVANSIRSVMAGATPMGLVTP